MTDLLERPQAEISSDEMRARVMALRPGEAFSLDRPITIEEYCALGEMPGRPELVNGVIQMSPPPTDAHEDAHGWLLTTLRNYVDARKLGKVRGSRSGVRIGTASVPEPDLVFFRSEHLSRMNPNGVHGAPDFAVEIVDSDKARREAVRKQAQYQDAGVSELWVIDLPRTELRHFLLEGGLYQRIAPSTEGLVEARMIEGFRLQGGWLFQGPDFPSSLEVVTRLLSAAQSDGQ
jgi:Uma2 family endonuclease